MKLLFITNQPDLARYAEHSGVDRIFVDLETLGKFERQGHRDTLISRHTVDDVQTIRYALTTSELLVRINPWNINSAVEIEEVIACGADFIMLPMIKSRAEVQMAGQCIGGRARFIPLIETVASAAQIGEIAALPYVDELYIGLNDLHLEMKCRFMFEPLANGMIDKMVAAIQRAGKPFGFGGIARVGEGIVPAELILGEHVRLGSSSVILSRTFHRQADSIDLLKSFMDFEVEIKKLRQKEYLLRGKNAQELEENRQQLVEIVNQVVKGK